MDKDGYHGYDKRSMKVEGPLHVVCQCDKCKAQPQRTWVGLTEEELYEIYDESDDGSSPCGVCGACAKCKIEVAIARAIEAKLRSKNG